MQNKKRIPVSDNVAYTQWEMPDLTGVKRRIAQRLNELKKEEGQQGQQEEQKKQQEQEKLLVKPVAPTPEELIAQAEQAKQEGYEAGFAEGLAAGQEEGRTQGYQEGEKTGEEAGFQAGYQRGLEQAEQEVDQQLARLQSLIEQLQGPIAALDQDVENALLSLVDLVCRAILRREVKLERGFLAEVLQEAIAALPVGHQRLRVFLNPEDLNLAEAACENLLEDYRLVGDPEVTLGGARVETLQSLVDSTLESRYKKIIDKLLGSAYQPAKDFTPLSEQVLDTPDAPPLDQAAFTQPTLTEPSSVAGHEPKQQVQPHLPFEASHTESASQIEPASQIEQEWSAEEALSFDEPLDRPLTDSHTDALFSEEALTEDMLSQPMPPIEDLLAESMDSKAADDVEPDVISEPIAQVSLQRGTTPRHEQPQDVQADDFNFNDAEDDLVDLMDLSELVNSPAAAAEAPIEDEPDDLFDVLAPNLFDETNNQPPRVQDDGLLPEFDLDEAEADFELLFSEDAAEEALFEENAVEEAELEETELEEVVAEEKNWSPESVHDARYLEEGALESSWLDAAEELADDKPLDVIEDQDIPHG